MNKKNRLLIITILTNLFLLISFWVLLKWPSWNYFSYIEFKPGPELWKIARHIPFLILPLTNLVLFLIYMIVKRKQQLDSRVQELTFWSIAILSVTPWLIKLIIGIISILMFFISPGKIGG